MRKEILFVVAGLMIGVYSAFAASHFRAILRRPIPAPR